MDKLFGDTYKEETTENILFTIGDILALKEETNPDPDDRPLPPDVKPFPNGFQSDGYPNYGSENPRRREEFLKAVSKKKVRLVRASKDAEIVRLRTQVLKLQHQLQRLKGIYRERSNALKTIPEETPMETLSADLALKRRQDGGLLVVPNGDKNLSLPSTSSSSGFKEKIRRNPKAPFKGSAPVKRGKEIHVFGSFRSKVGHFGGSGERGSLTLTPIIPPN